MALSTRTKQTVPEPLAGHVVLMNYFLEGKMRSKGEAHGKVIYMSDLIHKVALWAPPPSRSTVATCTGSAQKVTCKVQISYYEMYFSMYLISQHALYSLQAASPSTVCFPFPCLGVMSHSPICKGLRESSAMASQLAAVAADHTHICIWFSCLVFGLISRGDWEIVTLSYLQEFYEEYFSLIVHKHSNK